MMKFVIGMVAVLVIVYQLFVPQASETNPYVYSHQTMEYGNSVMVVHYCTEQDPNVCFTSTFDLKGQHIY